MQHASIMDASRCSHAASSVRLCLLTALHQRRYTDSCRGAFGSQQHTVQSAGCVSHQGRHLGRGAVPALVALASGCMRQLLQQGQDLGMGQAKQAGAMQATHAGGRPPVHARPGCRGRACLAALPTCRHSATSRCMR